MSTSVKLHCCSTNSHSCWLPPRLPAAEVPEWPQSSEQLLLSLGTVPMLVPSLPLACTGTSSIKCLKYETQTSTSLSPCIMGLVSYLSLKVECGVGLAPECSYTLTPIFLKASSSQVRYRGVSLPSPLEPNTPSAGTKISLSSTGLSSTTACRNRPSLKTQNRR